MMYEVAVHYYGRKCITRDGPAQGLLEWPQHNWGRITPRPIGLARARAHFEGGAPNQGSESLNESAP